MSLAKYKIIENFLDDDLFNEVYNAVNSPFLGWQIAEEKYEGNSLLNGNDYVEDKFSEIIDSRGFNRTDNRFDMQNVIFLRDYHGKRQEEFNSLPIMNDVQYKLDSFFNVKIPLKMKLNLGFCVDKNRVNSFHTDIMHLADIDYKTCVIYLNTNNGGTLMEDGTFIKSVANTLVMFEGNTQHAPVYQSDTKKRFVLNYNFI